VDVQISRLRRKLSIGRDGTEFIKTVRGGGYMFAASVTVAGAEEQTHAS
jgi:DNA-binding winged helix-turn-helix (wHTH) protein